MVSGEAGRIIIPVLTFTNDSILCLKFQNFGFYTKNMTSLLIITIAAWGGILAKRFSFSKSSCVDNCKKGQKEHVREQKTQIEHEIHDERDGASPLMGVSKTKARTYGEGILPPNFEYAFSIENFILSPEKSLEELIQGSQRKSQMSELLCAMKEQEGGSSTTIGESRASSSRVAAISPVTQENHKTIDEVPLSQNENDYISELPDEILSYIISHLTLRDATRMATLSRRWTNVMLSGLNFDCRVMSGFSDLAHDEKCKLLTKAYIKSVYQTLQRYVDHNISSFRFSFGYDKECATHVNWWLNFATKKRLASMELRFVCTNDCIPLGLKYDELYTIFSSYFSHFPYLKDLRLDACILKFNHNFTLNRLVSLNLNYVVLEGARWQCILSSFSTIEWLQLRRCNLPEKLHIGDNLNLLNFLMIDNCRALRELEINARNLQSFEFIGDMAPECTFLSSSTLENVFVSLWNREENRAECLLSNVARSLPGLKALSLAGQCSLMHKLPTHTATIFHSVVRLKLFMQCHDPEVNMLKFLPCLLKSFPLLLSLYVQMPFYNPFFDGRVMHSDNIPAPYVHTNLNEIELGEFETQYIAYASLLLKSAVNLERMVITKALKCYKGCGVVRHHFFPMLTREESECIRRALQGIAASSNVDLIIPWGKS